MRVAERARIGRSSVEVTRLGLGTAPLGDLFTRVDPDEAEAVVTTALDAGVTLVDTAPWYGLGLSEHRVGAAVRSRPRESVVLATKVGRVLRPARGAAAHANPSWAGSLPFEARFDYGYDGVVRSYEDSLQRLGLDRVELLAIHDLDAKHFAPHELDAMLRELANGGARALEELRTSSAVDAIGLGINTLGSIPRVLDVVDLDYAIIAMPYTLLDQDALDEELPLCLERGVSVIIGAVFASGVLASAPGAGAYRVCRGANRGARTGRPHARDRRRARRLPRGAGAPVSACASRHHRRDPGCGLGERGAREPAALHGRRSRGRVGGAQGGAARTRGRAGTDRLSSS